MQLQISFEVPPEFEIKRPISLGLTEFIPSKKDDNPNHSDFAAVVRLISANDSKEKNRKDFTLQENEISIKVRPGNWAKWKNASVSP